MGGGSLSKKVSLVGQLEWRLRSLEGKLLESTETAVALREREVNFFEKTSAFKCLNH